VNTVVEIHRIWFNLAPLKGGLSILKGVCGRNLNISYSCGGISHICLGLRMTEKPHSLHFIGTGACSICIASRRRRLVFVQANSFGFLAH